MPLREQGSGAQFGGRNKVAHARCVLGTTRHLSEEKPSTGVGSFLLMEGMQLKRLHIPREC